MISIIISYYRSQYLNNLKENIKQTIGVEYEIIDIENTDGSSGLCKVYNIGAQKAKYQILCFAHEDILMRTEDWGKKVIEIFDLNKNLGLLGIAGSPYKPVVPSGWSFAGGKTVFMNIIHLDKKSLHSALINENPNNRSYSKVASVDGVWFCTKKEIVIKLPFDEKLFKGFHCYDLDFSLSILNKYEAAVTFEILIEHYSSGLFNKEWVTETLKLHDKWKQILPVDLECLTKNQQRKEEENAFRFLLSVMERYNGVNSSAYKILWSNKIRSVLGINTFVKLHYTIVKSMYRQYLKKKKTNISVV